MAHGRNLTDIYMISLRQQIPMAHGRNDFRGRGIFVSLLLDFPPAMRYDTRGNK